MPYTSHGHWVGPTMPRPADLPPPPRARCGGPALCKVCGNEAVQAGHLVPTGGLVQRRRYATEDELVGLLAEDDLDTDLVRVVVERLGQLGVPAGALVRITIEEQLGGGT